MASEAVSHSPISKYRANHLKAWSVALREQGPPWAHLLSDLQGPLTQRLGFFVLPSFAVKHCKVVQSCGHLPTQETRKNGERQAGGTSDVSHTHDPQCVMEVLSGRLHSEAREQHHCPVGHKVTPQAITQINMVLILFKISLGSHKTNQNRSICKCDQILIKRQYKIFRKKFIEVHAIWFRIKNTVRDPFEVGDQQKCTLKPANRESPTRSSSLALSEEVLPVPSGQRAALKSSLLSLTVKWVG